MVSSGWTNGGSISIAAGVSISVTGAGVGNSSAGAKVSSWACSAGAGVSSATAVVSSVVEVGSSTWAAMLSSTGLDSETSFGSSVCDGLVSRF
ncbi:MAG: hypothetical protein CL912_18350 [Deltaproteobacteria bacterium]|nr:hypothetical protein [Deltaproteobacteria bacterium]